MNIEELREEYNDEFDTNYKPKFPYTSHYTEWIESKLVERTNAYFVVKKMSNGYSKHVDELGVKLQNQSSLRQQAEWKIKELEAQLTKLGRHWGG